MCGVMGYIGTKHCVGLIYDGLKRLEYRGYDSAGIAVLSGGEIGLVKSEGKLSQLEPLLPKLPREAVIGMGHTRWATHGAPTTVNAHPHTHEDISIIHNGIIENYRELKDELMASGVVFRSETDTEVVLHLLHAERKHARDMIGTIQRVVQRLRGAYALGIMSAKEPILTM